MTTPTIKSPKKLIEVALPLDDINAASAREKSIRHGHPSTLHLWWARRPLAAARAVIFAQMVNDPGYQQDGGFKYGVNKKEAEIKREKLFAIIRDLVKWENTNNEEVLERAREAIRESWRETCQLNRDHPQAAELFNPDKLPAFHDPFAGGGALPLEAQRLGLEAYASDLNPVAVMINKAMIEIPPKFAGRAPVGPIPEGEKQQSFPREWPGATGLAEDVRRYGHWMREEAFKRIGHLYPKVEITPEMVAERPDLKAYEGQALTVIAWLWARTVKSPNPAFSHVDVPLASTFLLSTKKGKEAYVEAVTQDKSYHFRVRLGIATDETLAKAGTKAARGASFRCIMSGTPINADYIKAQGMAGHIGTCLIAVVADSPSGRVYLSPRPEDEKIAAAASAHWSPEQDISYDSHSGATYCVLYGLTRFKDLFTLRQIAALASLTDLVKDAMERAELDASKGPHAEDGNSLCASGRGSKAYAEAIGVYLALAVSKTTDYCCALCDWHRSGEKIGHLFNRQAIPMKWDFCEVNPLSSSSGNFGGMVAWVVKSLGTLPAKDAGYADQIGAQSQSWSEAKVVSADPPYFDNVPYSDLSDFFYVWLRRSLRGVYPDLFSTLTTPKSEELVAFASRHANKAGADAFFLDGMTIAIRRVSELAHAAFPATIYYAFKQSETTVGDGTSSSGWETFLTALIKAEFSVCGTWPLRTELSNRMRGIGTNALASSIVLVCRKRDPNAGSISRREFQRELREQMPDALETMIGGVTGQSPIAPVDLAQAAIGPGMAIYSKYSAVLNQDGSPMSVHDALVMINRAITDYLNPDSGSFDADTLFCNDWFSQYGWSAGPFGEADTLARAKGTSVDGVRDAGVIESGAGKVRLFKWAEYSPAWSPLTDDRVPVWEACHQMIGRLNQDGESAAGALLSQMPEQGEPIRQLAYHLYTLCERKKWADEARAYNELIASWSAIVAASYETGSRGEQIGLEL